jgi:hypothetical protein
MLTPPAPFSISLLDVVLDLLVVDKGKPMPNFPKRTSLG